jgi:signal peptidase I
MKKQSEKVEEEIIKAPEPEIEPAAENTKKKTSAKRFLLELLETVVLAAALFFLIDALVARVRVENVSMEPTLYPGNFLLVSKMAYKWGSMHTGDIIVFHHNENGRKEDYIKRLIGISGDTVKAENGIVSVNGQTLTEPYIMDALKYEGTWIVPENTVFVLGDNRNDSSDSHDWGFVQAKDIIGKAFVVYWPLPAIRTLSHPVMVSAVTP